MMTSQRIEKIRSFAKTEHISALGVDYLNECLDEIERAQQSEQAHKYMHLSKNGRMAKLEALLYSARGYKKLFQSDCAKYPELYEGYRKSLFEKIDALGEET